MKILCDQMLGSLASWLRFMGIDTDYPTDQCSDEEILQKAVDKQRTLITRDKELLIRARKKNIPLIEISSSDLDEQLRLVISRVAIDTDKVLTRCSLCNTVLEPIEKQRVFNEVPFKVYENQTVFWKCPSCNRIYWKGSHYEKILEKIQKLR